jgi:hypothetical protein
VILVFGAQINSGKYSEIFRNEGQLCLERNTTNRSTRYELTKVAVVKEYQSYINKDVFLVSGKQNTCFEVSSSVGN